MPRSLLYGLAILVGALGGLLASAHLLVSTNPATRLVVLYAASLGLFLIGADAAVSTEHVRSFFRNADVGRRMGGLFVLSVLATTTLFTAFGHVVLGVARLVATPFGRAAEVVAGGSAVALAPAIVFLALLVIITILDFVAASQSWWRRVRTAIGEDWRGRLSLVLLATLVDAIVFSIVLREFEFLTLVAIFGFALGMTPLLDRLFTQSRIWAVARQTVAEALHYKVVVVWVVAILITIVVMPQAIAGDGLTLKSRVQSYLNFSLFIVQWGLSLLTLGLATYTLPNEILRKQIFMLVSKPLPRWQLITGKWLGIGVLNAALLLFSGGTVWGFTKYLSHQPGSVADDNIAIEKEVMSVRHAIGPAEPPDLVAQAEAVARKQRAEGLIGPEQEEEQKNSKLVELRQTWRNLRPGQNQLYVFRNLLVDRNNPDVFLHLQIKPNSSSGVDDILFPIVYQAGDPEDTNTLTPVQQMEIPTERVSMIVVPAFAVNAEGTLKFRIMNLSPRDTMTFEEANTFELLYGIGTFHWNLVRAIAIMWCRLAFITAMAMVFASFLSAPVAFIATALPFLIAMLSGFITESLDNAAQLPSGKDPIWGPLQLGRVLVPLAKGVVWLLPDFAKYDPIGNVVDGRLVPLMWVAFSFGWLVLVSSAVLGALACVVLTSRELAREGA